MQAPQRQPKLDLMNSYRLDPNDASLFEPTPGMKKRKLCLAIFLLVIGITLLTVGLIELHHGMEGSIAMITIGGFAFLPGFYFTRVAYMAWRGVEGFSLNDIPEV